MMSNSWGTKTGKKMLKTKSKFVKRQGTKMLRTKTSWIVKVLKVNFMKRLGTKNMNCPKKYVFDMFD